MNTHLSDEDLEYALLQDQGPATSRPDEKTGMDVQFAHLESCELCQERFRLLKDFDETLAILKVNERVPAGSHCPDESNWIALAANVPTEIERDFLITHASQCDHCGPLFREAVADLTGSLNVEQQACLESLESSTMEWQHTTARKLQSVAVSEQRSLAKGRFQWIPQLLDSVPLRVGFALTLIGAAAAGVWFSSHRGEANDAGQLIADAYEEKRTLEVRIGKAPFVPLRQERGGDSAGSRMSLPALLKAEAEIAGHLQADPEDVSWLQASGEANLLEGSSEAAEAAITTLEKGHRLAPGNSSVSVDLASAYLIRGQFLNRPEDFGQAVDILGSVVSSQQADETAYFNYAIALEKQLLKRQAADAWRTYLSKFPNSSWAREAQDHLSNLDSQLHDQQGRSEAPLKTLDQVAEVFASRDAAEISRIDARIEEYQDLAVDTWLPRFLFGSGAAPAMQTNVSIALNGLSGLFSENHGDHWLADLLKTPPHSGELPHAARLLAEGSIEIETPRVAQAERDATDALSIFRRARAPAGQLRSQLILTLASQYQHRDRTCEAIAQTMRNEPSLLRYAWIRGQVELENSLCGNVTSARTQEAAQSAIEIAKTHHFPILYLRAISAQSTLYSALGDTHRAWSTAKQGLQIFWDGAYPRLRGYSSLTAMEEINFPQGRWFLEKAILQEAMPMVDGDPRTTMVAVELARLSQTLMETGDFDGAERSYQQTELLLSKSPPGALRDTLSAEAELGFAKVDLNRNRLDASLERLEKIRSDFLSLPDDFLMLDFYQTSGLAQLRSDHLIQAQTDLNAAIGMAETGLRAVETEDDRWKWSRQNEATYRALAELELRRDPRRAFIDWEWYKGAPLRDRRSETALGSRSSLWPVSQDEEPLVVPKLSDGASLVSFLMFPQGYAVWVWDETGLREKWISASKPELSALVASFLEACSDPRSSPSSLRAAGAQLYRMIILPIEPWLAGHRRILIEPDGVLKALPIGLLVNSRGEYFGDRYVISTSPGTMYLNRSRRWTGISPSSSALVMGDPKAPGWLPLPDAEEEARIVASSFIHPRLSIQGSETPTRLAEEIARSEVFHFSGHARISTQTASLVAGDNGLSDEVYLDAVGRGHDQLVVLSACSSSEGTAALSTTTTAWRGVGWPPGFRK